MRQTWMEEWDPTPAERERQARKFNDEPLRTRLPKNANSVLNEIPMWPIVTGISVAFMWAVNVLSPGALSFITGFTFIDSVMLGIIIGSLAMLVDRRKKERNSMAEEIMADLAKENSEENSEPEAQQSPVHRPGFSVQQRPAPW